MFPSVDKSISARSACVMLTKTQENKNLGGFYERVKRTEYQLALQVLAIKKKYYNPLLTYDIPHKYEHMMPLLHCLM